MKFFRTDLLTLLISLFVFASCKGPGTVGLDPEIEIIGTLDSTVTLSSQTEREQPVSTANLTQYPLGNMNDAVFGKTEASVAMGVDLPSQGYSFGKNAQLDSVFLVLKYAPQFYGDSTSNYTFTVNQLGEVINTSENFRSDRVWPVNSQVLGTYTGKLSPKTPLKINDVITGKDTLRTVPAQIRIRLNRDFFAQNLLGLDSASRATTAAFNRALKGFHVRASVPAGSNGGVALIDFSAAAEGVTGYGNTTSLEVYYRKQNATTATQTDTVGVAFPITTAVKKAATIKHDYTGTPVADQLANPSMATQVTFLQGLTGIRNRISFPGLKTWGQQKGRVIVNKAELVVNLAPGTYVSPFTPAPLLSLYRTDIAGQPVRLPDNNPYDSQRNPTGDFRSTQTYNAFGGIYDQSKGRYVFNIAFYIQDLLDGKLEDTGTFLYVASPDNFTFGQPQPSLVSAGRSVINSFTAPGKKLKLNIYYTVVN
ncbi:DUF4270 domain-containing protein [Pedobacter sp. SYP-B3415]|uniref:DUF4270 domain-containing protein n=1 Tax=Pedobacter sp. SYP-B3415 TaxID=2496641 RepID=UPI00101D8845|nr:DUF4270 domain-containing protein [Pedobacter sp. SYP-B3415]